MAHKKGSPEKTNSQAQPVAEEARHLAEEAMDEMQHGNKEEAKFVLEEARALDKKAADEVVQDKQKSGG
jgi:hypothetical protein